MSNATMLGFGVGWQEILVILVIVLLLFGGKKLPELARGLGRSMRIFKDEVHGLQKDFKETSNIDNEPTDVKDEAPPRPKE